MRPLGGVYPLPALRHGNGSRTRGRARSRRTAGGHLPSACLRDVELPPELKDVPLHEIAAFLHPDDNSTIVVGQLRPLGSGKAKLWWVAPRLKKGVASRWIAILGKGGGETGFVWAKRADGFIDLLLDGRKVMRYQHACDRSTPERLHETYKPFHHVFDGKGESLLTKGQGGLYTHHRGIFIGWNRLTFEGAEHDLWHMKKGFQRHEKFLELHAGPVLAGQKLLIHWIDGNGKTAIVEEREITVFRQTAPAIALIDFKTRLLAANGEVFLNGDPEHGGFQYRAHNGIAEGPKEVKAVYLFHKDGIDAHKDTNLPWAAMTYGPAGGRITVQHMSHPANSKPSVYSAYRDYGRFGAFFKATIPAGKALDLSFRIHVAEEEGPKREAMAARYAAFAAGVKAEPVSR